MIRRQNTGDRSQETENSDQPAAAKPKAKTGDQ